MAKKKKGSYCTLSSKYFAFELWAFICRNNQPPCLWGLYSSKLKRETAVCLINVCRAPARYCWIVCFPIFPQDMSPKSTAREKNIGKSQTNVPLWAHACRHKSSIHLQQNVYSYFWGFTGCKYEHRLFDKKRWTNTQVDAIFWARAAAPKLPVINPTLITAYSWHFIARHFSSSPRLLDSRDSLNISISHSLTSPVVQVAWGGITFKLLGIRAMRNYSANRRDCKLKALDKRSQIKEASWLVLLRGKKTPNQPSDFCHPWVLQVGHLAGC